MHRFLIPWATPDPQGRIDLSPIARQNLRVLRLASGDTIGVLDGTGRAYTLRLTYMDGPTLWGEVIDQGWLPEPALRLTLYQCALKHDKFEWVLQKGTELGISAFVPVVSARSVVRPVAALEKKRARWENILREATEQCGRGVMPTLAPAQDWDAALGSPVLGESKTSDRSQPLKLVAWEAGADPSDPHHQGTIPSLGNTVAAWRAQNHASHTAPDTATPNNTGPNNTDRPHIALCIGPEGGLDAQEIALAQAGGWQIVHLGPRILRAETAALVAATIILHLFDEYSQTTSA